MKSKKLGNKQGVKVEFVKTGYKSHKIIRLYAKVELWEVVVQIEGNLRTKVQ